MEESTLIRTEGLSRAVVVGVCKDGNELKTQEDLDELCTLLQTLGIQTAARVVQKRPKLTASHLLGMGKAEAIKILVEEHQAGLVVVDHALSGPQVRNLEEVIGCQVIDRAGVILDIFARHARSSQAKTQVQIAQLEYLLPRLSGAWTHFQRQSGGGISRGMGEKQIEIDRRRARERIHKLQKRLEQIAKEKETQRKQRVGELRVALVGYTNSGKTSLMQLLTTSVSVGKDELFATLDTQTKLMDPNTRPKILLSDTVGFIRNLPHSLVESFKSTLQEVTGSDLLIHVVDISHPHYAAHRETTEEVLRDIGAAHIPTLLVFNKIDRVEEAFLAKILERKHSKCMALSAFSPQDGLRLRQCIYDYFQTQFEEARLVISPLDAGSLSLVYTSCVIMKADYNEDGHNEFLVKAPAHTLAKLEHVKVVS